MPKVVSDLRLRLYVLIISSWFKWKARFGFCHQLLLKLPRVTVKKDKKTWFRQVFSFSSFRYFLHFSINLSKCIWIMTYTLGGTLLLLKIRPVSRFFVDRNHINQLQAYTFFMSVLASSCLILYFLQHFYASHITR